MDYLARHSFKPIEEDVPMTFPLDIYYYILFIIKMQYTKCTKLQENFCAFFDQKTLDKNIKGVV